MGYVYDVLIASLAHHRDVALCLHLKSRNCKFTQRVVDVNLIFFISFALESSKQYFVIKVTALHIII